MQEHPLRVQRTARYHVLGDPGPGVRRFWYVLHGYGQLAASLLRQCEPLATAGTLVVAPEALSRFYVAPPTPTEHAKAKVGASWMTREARDGEIADYVDYLDQLHAHLLDQCGSQSIETRVLGFSQGVATAGRWAILGKTPAPAGLVLWAGHPPPELRTEQARTRLAATELVLAVGDADPYVSSSDLAQTLDQARGLGYRVRALEFSGGHVIHAEALARLTVAERA